MYAHALVLHVYLLMSTLMFFNVQTNEILRNVKSNGTNIFIVHLLLCTTLHGCSQMTNTEYIYTHRAHTYTLFKAVTAF